jgi:prenyltransferase beta subunit
VAAAAERRPSRRRRTALVAAAGAAIVVVAALVAAAGAETPSGKFKPTLDRTVAFLQRDQNLDGGFGGEAGSPSDPDFSAWVALALAAASVNPHDQKRVGGTDVYTYLAAHAGELEVTTDFERALMVVNTAEYPPRPLGGVNLVEKVLEGRIASSGAFSHELGGTTPGMNDTIFAILALAPIKEARIEAVVHEAAEWVIKEQNADHSWPSWCPKSVCTHAGKEPQDSTDMTGAALEALNAAGMHGTEAQVKALEYLHKAQLPDGGWPQAIGEAESNVGSTAWVCQGIWAAGGNPENWIKGGHEPLGYMASLQKEDGHIRYMESHELNGVWMTSYATPAFSGQALPIPYVPPAAPGSEEAQAEETGAGEVSGTKGSSHGNEGLVHGEGVDAGGGGEGAPLFSRPKPQSKGKTPGGARVVHHQALKPRDHSKNRRGANQHQPRGTEKSEPREESEGDQEAAAVSGAAVTGAGEGGGGGDEGTGTGDRGAPLPVGASPHESATSAGEAVSGTVIGSPEGTGGKLAFGAPGLKGGGGEGSGLAAAITIGALTLIAAGLGAGWERRRGLPA